jgi:glycosyltransferase involved in cell wall biosynthesis
VLPSYHEGLPISLIEGGAAGCPLIGTNIPGIRDTIENGLNGFLVPLDDKNAFIESIELLTENKELRLSMGKASRTKMLREFSQSRLLKSYEDFYAEIISEKK